MINLLQKHTDTHQRLLYLGESGRIKYKYSLLINVRKCNKNIHKISEPIPVAARSKAWVFGRSLTSIVGSNADPSGRAV
jgi:hypothetical protein